MGSVAGQLIAPHHGVFFHGDDHRLEDGMMTMDDG